MCGPAVHPLTMNKTMNAYRKLWQRLVPLYDNDEAKAIARMVFEIRYGLTLSDLLMERDADLPQEELEQLAHRLEQGEPVQYVLGEAEFCERRFYVEPGILIPRTETQWLCDLVTHSQGYPPHKARILDIGTGSGCIACTIALNLKDQDVEVTGWDISGKALNIAQRNAKRLGAKVTFEQVDVLSISPLLTSPDKGGTTDNGRPSWDLIVSNPPYVCEHERQQMERNVLDWEPEEALFVPDNDPLLFYRSIAIYAQRALKEKGWLYFEINPLYANELVEMLSKMSYHDIEIKNDQFGKQRFIRARQ